jgi:hypothetical protein
MTMATQVYPGFDEDATTVRELVHQHLAPVTASGDLLDAARAVAAKMAEDGETISEYEFIQRVGRKLGGEVLSRRAERSIKPIWLEAFGEAMGKKQCGAAPRKVRNLTTLDETIPAVTPGKDATVGAVIGERADVYTQVPGDPCALSVPSATRPGVTYTVRFHPATGALSCDCPGYLNAKPGKTCRHCAAWTPEPEAEAFPVSVPRFRNSDEFETARKADFD